MDYGTPCNIPPELIEQAKAQAKLKADAIEKRQKDFDKKSAKGTMRDATNGDMSAQYSLGIR